MKWTGGIDKMNKFGPRAHPGIQGSRIVDVGKLLEAYDLSVQGVERWSKGYTVWTDQDMKALRLFQCSHEELEYVTRAIEYLHSNGFTRCGRVILTRDGSPYVRDGDNLYYLTDVQKVDPIDAERLCTEGARLIAEFHMASKGFDSYGVRDVWGDWEGGFARQYERLKEYKALVEQKWRKSDFDRWFLYYVDYFLSQCDRTFDMLSSSVYKDTCRWRRSEGGFCHASLRWGNILQNSSEELTLINLEGLIGDTPVRDIGDLLIFIGKWELDKVDKFLDTYNKINPLTREEIELVQAYLRFPHLFCDTIFQYYEKGQLHRELAAKAVGFLEAQKDLDDNFLTIETYNSIGETDLFKDKSAFIISSCKNKDIYEEDESKVEEEVEVMNEVREPSPPDGFEDLLKELAKVIESGNEDALLELSSQLKEFFEGGDEALWEEFIKLGGVPKPEIFSDLASKVEPSQEGCEEEAHKVEVVIEEKPKIVEGKSSNVKEKKYGTIVWDRFPDPLD